MLAAADHFAREVVRAGGVGSTFAGDCSCSCLLGILFNALSWPSLPLLDEPLCPLLKLARDKRCMGPDTVGFVGPSCGRWELAKRAYRGVSGGVEPSGAGAETAGLALDSIESFLSRNSFFMEDVEFCVV